MRKLCTFQVTWRRNKVWTTLKLDMNIIILVLVLGATVRRCAVILTTLQSPFSPISSTCVFVTLKLGFSQSILDLAMTLRVILSNCAILYVRQARPRESNGLCNCTAVLRQSPALPLLLSVVYKNLECWCWGFLITEFPWLSVRDIKIFSLSMGAYDKKN